MSPLVRLLCPPQPRTFAGERWLNIALRCLHLVGVAGIGGGFLFDLEHTRWLAFWHLTLASGVLLSLLYLWGSALWLLQLKGLAIVLKVALLALAWHWVAWRGELFILVILISGLMAHAPGRVRGYRLGCKIALGWAAPERTDNSCSTAPTVGSRASPPD